MEADEDFEYQLKQEELERQKLTEESTKCDAQSNSEQRTSAAEGSTSNIYVDPVDGTAYEWDYDKRAWFPKIDENFIATYQASYGSHQLDLTQPSLPPEEVEMNEKLRKQEKALSKEEQKRLQKEKKKEKRKLAAERQKNASWFDMDESQNTNVYVSGLPLDFTDQKFEELMAKCGVIALDITNRKSKLKLYRDEEGNLKGDGRCCYIKRESVDLALDILDGSQIGDNQISVQVAKFELKGDYDPSKRKKLNPKMKKKLKEQQERIFGWHPEKMRGERPKSDSTVVIKNAFTIEELNVKILDRILDFDTYELKCSAFFQENPVKLFDLREELKQECSKYGNVRKIIVCDNNVDGVVLVTFGAPEEADDCVTMMNYRIFVGRQLRAATWDGRTKYKVDEKNDEKEKRLSNWDKFLNGEEVDQKEDGKNVDIDTESTTQKSVVEQE
uniref:17S U2 SnRNP complex component HTATSF1 n=1 Tax=Romanomermis culicivorax TaxID=13658 RepID=A0A915JB03_ROMCU